MTDARPPRATPCARSGEGRAQDTVLAPDIFQLLLLLQHTPGAQTTVDSAELLLQALQLRVREETIVDTLRVLLPLLLTPQLPPATAELTTSLPPGAAAAVMGASKRAGSKRQIESPGTPDRLHGGGGKLGGGGPREAEPTYMRLVHIGALQVPRGDRTHLRPAWAPLAVSCAHAASGGARARAWSQAVVSYIRATDKYSASGRRGLLTRMLDSVLETERAHFLAAAFAGGNDAGGDAVGEEAHRMLTEVIRDMSTIAGCARKTTRRGGREKARARPGSVPHARRASPTRPWPWTRGRASPTRVHANGHERVRRRRTDRRVPDMDNMVLKFNEIVITDSFTSSEQLVERLQAHYSRGTLRMLLRLMGAARILGNTAALLDKLGSGFATGGQTRELSPR